MEFLLEVELDYLLDVSPLPVPVQQLTHTPYTLIYDDLNHPFAKVNTRAGVLAADIQCTE
jgi:hypothetical protein